MVVGVFAAQEQLRIEIDEFVNQTITYNPLESGSGLWNDANEVQTRYSIKGYINVTNQNPEGLAIYDIYISFSNTENITLPTLSSGRTGTFRTTNVSSGSLTLHIPEIASGESSIWVYDVNTTYIRPPLNMTSSYSDTKLLAGGNLTVVDTIINNFGNYSFQTDSCLNSVVINQTTVPINFSGTFYNFTFDNASIAGADSGNVSFTSNLQNMQWDVWGGDCFYKDNTTNINYTVNTPYNIPNTQSYNMTRATLSYSINNSISHLRIADISAISEAELSFEKKILSPSHPTLYGRNVTWNVTGHFNSTLNNITYNLTRVTFWVSQRNYNGSYTDPNALDTDKINTSITLEQNLTPGAYVNITQPWTSSSWLFNYSDIPSPIVWMEANFTIVNDGVQLINRSITRSNNDTYIKEIYLILGYWLEIEKNVTSLGSDVYHIRIDVHNKGNQVTPANTVVTVYDFVPTGFTNTTQFTFSSSPWYTTTSANNSITGTYSGVLYQWGLVPANSLNTSFSQGPGSNENTTWSVDVNVTGSGDYEVSDVFVTGLDPQQVDGAGSTKAVIVSEVLERIRSTEGIFAAVASVLLLLGLLL